MKNPWDIKKEDFPSSGSLHEKIKFILGYAILAPSTHNTQPWLFKIKPNSCEIYYNEKLKLPEADPLGRDLYISMGCMVENLIIAANYFGIYKEFKLEFRDNFIGEIFFQEQGEVNADLASLVEAITQRVNVRGLFENKDLPEGINVELKTLNKDQRLNVNFINNKDKIASIAELTARGLRMAHGKPEFRKEMSGWMANSLSRRKDGLLGYSLRMPFLLSFVIPVIIKFVDLSRVLARLNYISMASAPAVCIIDSEKNEPEIWFEVGRLAERLILYLNSKGMRTSIFVVSIEIGELYKDVQKILGSAFRPQFLFCIGYMDKIQKRSPRYELEHNIIQ